MEGLAMPDHALRSASDQADPATPAAFTRAVKEQIVAFESASLVQRVVRREVALPHYHAILTTLFHQTRSSPYTFAEAAIHCSWAHAPAKEYLLQHAEEERIHWRWILDDLSATGYAGPDPRMAFPHPTCEAYIAFNERVARHAPVARLAIASVLEGIGAAFGERYGRQLLHCLGLEGRQASFFLSHGETDRHHSEELRQVIRHCDLQPAEWAWMAHAATVAGQLYRAMYCHEAFA